ncbi:MAG: nucleoside hydrolase, partial [Flavitalea sp.]
FLTNIDNLLRTAPDQYSSLSGRDLIKKKVKRLVSMAGIFPSGREFNVYADAQAAQAVFNNWPTPVIFSGFEIGLKIRTGIPLINNEAITASPIKDVFRISIPLDQEDSLGRMSWDETAVLTGILGPATYYTLHEGAMVVNNDGSNSWNDKLKKQQSYLVEKAPYEEVQTLINNLMMHQPK